MFVLQHVVDSLQCICRQDIEESEHFLSNGPLYLIQWQDMLRKLNQLNIVNACHAKTVHRWSDMQIS